MTSVWIKLYIGEGDKDPRIFEIFDNIRNVSHLRKKIKEEEQLAFPASLLDVYPQGTDVSNLEGAQGLRLGQPPPSDTTDEMPLIVVAPKPGDEEAGQVGLNFDVFVMFEHF